MSMEYAIWGGPLCIAHRLTAKTSTLSVASLASPHLAQPVRSFVRSFFFCSVLSSLSVSPPVSILGKFLHIVTLLCNVDWATVHASGDFFFNNLFPFHPMVWSRTKTPNATPRPPFSNCCHDKAYTILAKTLLWIQPRYYSTRPNRVESAGSHRPAPNDHQPAGRSPF